MKWWIFPISLVAALLSIWLLLYADVPLSTLLSLGLGAISLLWLVLLLVVPWNLYFGARALTTEIRESRERGIQIPADRDEEARHIARRMLVMAIGGHLVSAAVIAVIAFFSGMVVGYYFVGFYLLSTAFRPAAAYLQHLRGRVSVLMREARYPREDAVLLKSRVDQLTAAVDALSEQVRLAEQSVREELSRTESEVAGMDRRLNGIALKFEGTLDRLTDNHEVITGLKAFLRLLKTG